MTTVLLVAAADPPRDVLAAALAEFAAAGADVDLALARDRKGTVTGLPLRSIHVLRRPAGRLRAGLPAAALRPGWWRRAARTGASLAVTRRGDLALRTWFAARWDPWVGQELRRADVLVALDRHAVYTVWRLARRVPGAAAVHGLDAGVRAVRARAPQPAVR
jgi:hypothetical protein